MKIIKSLVALVITALIVTFSITPALALDSDDIPIDHEAMIKDGWNFKEEEGYYINDIIWPYISLFSSSEPHYPDWDPDKLPWAEMPDYVKDIAYDTVVKSDFEASDYTNFKIPFVMINFNGEYCTIYIGYNLAPVYNTASGVFNVCGAPGYGSYANCVCYIGQYNADYTLKTEWYNAEPTEWGTSGRIAYFSLYSMTQERENDIYYYGGSGLNLTVATQFSTWLSVTDSGLNSNQCYWVSQTGYGYSAGQPFIYNQSSFASYFEYYTVPTEQEIEQNFLTALITDLKNYILYFDDEKPVHVNPFSDILTELNENFEYYSSEFSLFSDTLDETLNNVVSYIENGSGILTSILDGVPILLYFIIFFIAFAIVRKVVGR